MKEGPDIARLGALIGDPARANMLTSLMGGKALTASELAAEGGVTQQTASSHLGKLAAAGLVRQRSQGRHRYFALADAGVGGLLEVMMGLAAKRGHVRTRTGPTDLALRKARVCYDHLAGEMGVRLFEGMTARALLAADDEGVRLTHEGLAFASDFGIDVPALQRSRRPLCRACLDWSARRTHLAGGLGTVLLHRFYGLGWAERRVGSRVVAFSAEGEAAFHRLFPG